jgi:hypothetical protein
MATSFVPETRKVVMISSTARDLPQHREQARKACAALGMFPQMMEDLRALDKTPVQACKDMVEQSHYYVGIFGQSYGTIAKGYNISFTEIEFKHAIDIRIPCYLFIMHDNHMIRKADIDCRNVRKLKNLIEIAKARRVCDYFESPEDLYGRIVASISTINYYKG